MLEECKGMVEDWHKWEKWVNIEVNQVKHIRGFESQHLVDLASSFSITCQIPCVGGFPMIYE